MGLIIFEILLVLIGCHHHHTIALHLTDISVPEVADYRDIATLSCSYNMGTHALNSVKWYKDDMEFFRYAPMMYPTIVKFPVDGVTFAEQTYNCNKNTCIINLEHLGARTSGAYRCEISGDAPEFKLVSKTANMTIAALPRQDPDINGIAHSYAFGDFVLANCTSDKSSPPASLSWFINDEKASPELLQPQQETTIPTNEFLLRYRSLEIRFHLDKDRFSNMKQVVIKCVSKIDRFPQLIREKTHKIYIMSTDDLTNQKLVRNTGNNVQHFFHSFIVILFTGFLKRVLIL